MRIVCAPKPSPLAAHQGVAFAMFQGAEADGVGWVGAALPVHLRRAGIRPAPRAWDFLALSLGVVAADDACPRGESPDGWTRHIDLEVAVVEPSFWELEAARVEAALRFLTGDVWRVRFLSGGIQPPRPTSRIRRRPTGDSVCLLSGGVDSLVGAVDLVDAGRQPILVSQVAQGDGERQRRFARAVGPDLTYLQLSHAVQPPGAAERSQRARSMIFLAFGVVAATALPSYRRGGTIDLVVPENGFISLNVPLTPLRIGSLSTRTTHPHFLRLIQEDLDAAGIHVVLQNPYQFKTKGEMLAECHGQALLHQLVHDSTSCGRFAHWNYQHCGRCVPCLVRRAALHRWTQPDMTAYRFDNLAIPDERHRDFDDVRSAAFAVHQAGSLGVGRWAGSALSSALLGSTLEYEGVVECGLAELASFLRKAGAA